MERGGNTPELRTDRLILRKFLSTDMEALFRIYSDREVNRFLPWYPVETMEETKRLYAEKYEDFYRRPSGYRYAVCRKEDNIPIGYVHVSPGDSRDFGYALLKEQQGKGYAAEAGRAVLEQMKLDGCPFATATHDVQNPKSGAVMRRLGMTYRYSYEEQWQPKNIPVIFRMYQIDFQKGCKTYGKYWEQYERHFVEENL